ncbi:MAG: class I adenylate cyclase [Deltaproteobacteria bacterium]|jgi:adenylate cyclase class 1|nr:class I adenylate cyclase [Deltaproteobacteria bacterium]
MSASGLKEKMLYNLKAQERNNRARIRELRSRATGGFKEVFDMVPSLIHHNIEELPAYLPDPGTPHGLLFYDEWRKRAQRLNQCAWLSGPDPEIPAVESLLLIGSSGSVGHTARSDLDYWVCYRPSVLKGESLELFRKKLARVSAWARDVHDTEANFYLVDLSLLAAGRIANHWNEEESQSEAEGEVAPTLLLEELYRTMILVAGRAPLWPVWPPESSKEEYLSEVKSLAPLDWRESPPRYLDFGYPEKAAPQEYLAAAMWLTCKSESDPFKGILKIIPILEALETNFQAPLLCETVKEGVLTNEDPETAVDPYIVTVERVMAFAASRLPREQLNLIRDSAILKVLGLTGKVGESLPPKPDPAKEKVISGWIKEWNWPEEKLLRLLNYNQWSDRERLEQGYDLLLLLFRVHTRIANRLLTAYPGEVNAAHNELLPFAARILGRQKGFAYTVDLLPSKFHRDSLSHDLALIRNPTARTWGVHDNSEKTADPGELWRERGSLLYETGRVAKAAAWIVRNGLHGDGFRVSVPQPAGGIPEENFLELLKIMAEAFPPFSFKSLDPDTIWSAAARGAVLVCLNLEIPQEAARVMTADLVYRTGWGEIRHQFRDVSLLLAEADKYQALGEALISSCGLLNPADLQNGTPFCSQHLKRAFGNLKAVSGFSLARGGAAGASTGSQSRIDL